MYKVLGADLHWPMFPLISHITQQQQQQSAMPFSKQPTNKNPSIPFPLVVGSNSCGGGRYCNKRNLLSTSLNVNSLGKAAVLHFALCSLLRLGLCQTHPANYWAQLYLCQILIGFSWSAPHLWTPQLLAICWPRAVVNGVSPGFWVGAMFAWLFLLRTLCPLPCFFWPGWTLVSSWGMRGLAHMVPEEVAGFRSKTTLAHAALTSITWEEPCGDKCLLACLLPNWALLGMGSQRLWTTQPLKSSMLLVQETTCPF
jgi:hypothetical protein